MKKVKKTDWKIHQMPTKKEKFILQRTFDKKQMALLEQGHIPQEMEDKWFWYMEGNKLYAHRSWTGYCIYIIEFSKDNNHKVTVNREFKQYGCTSIETDRDNLNELLNWWCGEPYDYYNEWLSEIAALIERSSSNKDKLNISGREVDAVFFHKPEEPYGYLSNWYESPFDIDGVHYSSVEQYIMYQKCKIFGDEVSAAAVLATDDPKEQQSIGKKTTGYVNSIWAGVRQIVAVRGLLAKFSQNEELKKMLLATNDAYLVECAHSDKIWACGIRLDSDDRFDSGKWLGDNILGFALMEVRRHLRGNRIDM